MEIELKLQIAEDDVEKIASSGLFGSDPDTLELKATYFDTPERQLRANGFSLRIRRENDQLVQTLKGTSRKAAGLFARPEWERVVPSETLVIDSQTPLAMLLGHDADSLTPVFRMSVKRRRWQFVDGEDAVECALDVGEILASERRSPIHEMEMESKRGDLAVLFRLARQLDELAPVRLSVNSKAERGYLFLEAQAESFKAESVELVPEMSAQSAFQAIITACLRHYRLNEALLLDTRNPAALHQARVALRRLRAALTIFKALYADDDAELIRRDLKWLAGLLGEGRDLDVLIKRNEAEALRERLQTARDEAYDRIITALNGKRVRMMMIDLVEWTSMGPWLTNEDTHEQRTKPAPIFAAQPLKKFRKKVKKGGGKLDQLEEAERHEVRKDAKKLRYAAEFFAGLYTDKRQRRRHGKFVAALEALQDQLGALNDLAAAPDLIQHLGLSDDPDAQALAGGTKKKKLIAAASEAHGDFADAKRFWE
ncbi:CHAD domain-containing protein [Tianweitania sediminis]|uniref:Inorganic triphosphatase n=1 Tax=Tianweitania sediminis TaxID=1502156 RepID=A0A8J7RIQ7_9HYPH|nr:CHAD domain-containing protein [Tianweitania sediminis]MBP0437946.1 inorganic triphosphatase [Tianweitania sediminis]